MTEEIEGVDDKGLLHDERGSVSTARASWWITLLYTLFVCTLDLSSRLEVPGIVYATLTTALVISGSWAGGARIAQYLLPQIGDLVKSISASFRSKLDNKYKDNEQS